MANTLKSAALKNKGYAISTLSINEAARFLKQILSERRASAFKLTRGSSLVLLLCIRLGYLELQEVRCILSSFKQILLMDFS